MAYLALSSFELLLPYLARPFEVSLSFQLPATRLDQREGAGSGGGVDAHAVRRAERRKAIVLQSDGERDPFAVTAVRDKHVGRARSLPAVGERDVSHLAEFERRARVALEAGRAEDREERAAPGQPTAAVTGRIEASSLSAHS